MEETRLLRELVSATAALTTLLHKESFPWADLSAWMKDGTDRNHNKRPFERSLGLFYSAELTWFCVNV